MNPEKEESMDLSKEEVDSLTNINFYGRLADAAQIAMDRGETKITFALPTFALLCRIAALRTSGKEQLNWNTMDTVPRDGTPVFLAHADGDWEFVEWMWDTSEKRWVTDNTNPIEDDTSYWFENVPNGPAFWSPTPRTLTEEEIGLFAIANIATLEAEDPEDDEG